MDSSQDKKVEANKPHFSSVQVPLIGLHPDQIITNLERNQSERKTMFKLSKKFIEDMYIEKMIVAKREEKFKIFTTPIPKECGTLELTIKRISSGFINILTKYCLMSSSGLMLLNSK